MSVVPASESRAIAQRYLASLPGYADYHYVIVDGRTREEEFGWVFFYESEEYLATGAPEAELLGNAPFAVDLDGQIHKFGTGYPVTDYIELLSKEWQRTKGPKGRDEA